MKRAIGSSDQDVEPVQMKPEAREESKMKDASSAHEIEEPLQIEKDSEAQVVEVSSKGKGRSSSRPKLIELEEEKSSMGQKI